MAIEVYDFTVVVAAGTLQASPQKTAMAMPPRVVREIEVLVPPGPRGELGFAIGSAGNAVLPRNAGSFVVTDNEVIHWPLEDQHDSGAWQLIAYNTGTYPHSVYVRFLVDLPGQQTGGGTQLIDGGALSGGGTGLPPVQSVPPPVLTPILPPVLPPIPVPTLPGLPALPGPPGQTPPALTPRGDDMNQVSTTRPDGGTDFYNLLSDGSVVHSVKSAAGEFIIVDYPVGSYLSLIEAGYHGTAVAFVRGIGGDKRVWETSDDATGGGWQDKRIN